MSCRQEKEKAARQRKKHNDARRAAIATFEAAKAARLLVQGQVRCQHTNRESIIDNIIYIHI